MTYLTILKLDIDHISGTTYENRLLVGDINSVVDIRFDHYPGYIENVHSIYFEGDFNGSHDAGVSTLKSGGNVTDLVFFDPSNNTGKTLTELVAGGGSGLWEDDASKAWLTAPKIIDAQDQDIVNVNDFCGKDDDDFIFYGANQSKTGTNEFMRWKWDGQILQMNSKKITGLANGTASDHAATVGQSVTNPMTVPLAMGNNAITGIGGITMNDATSPIDMTGSQITDVAAIKGKLGLDVSFWGSDDSSPNVLVEYMLWDKSVEQLKIKKPIKMSANIDMHGQDVLNINNIKGKLGLDVSFWGSDDSSPNVLVEYMLWDKSVEQLKIKKPIKMGANIDMGTNDITGVGGITMNNATSPIDMNGSEITNVTAIKGEVGATKDVVFWGSNIGGIALVEIMRYDVSQNQLVMSKSMIIESMHGTLGTNTNLYGSNSAGSAHTQFLHWQYATEVASLYSCLLHYKCYTANPAWYRTGSMWYRSDLGVFHYYNGAVIKTIATV